MASSGKTSARKTSGDKNAVQLLKADIDAGSIANVYLFHGQETYLRDYYIDKIRDALIPETVSAFNFHRTEGENLTVQTLTEMTEAMPMMSERTLIVVWDFDILRLSDEQSARLTDLLNDLPPWCCVIFVYDTIAYKSRAAAGTSGDGPEKNNSSSGDSSSGNHLSGESSSGNHLSGESSSGGNISGTGKVKGASARAKKLRQTIREHVRIVDFQPLGERDLRNWVTRRFRELGKQISPSTADYLIFTCGDLMTGLIPEIEKTAAYALSDTVTQNDIDTVADPVLSTEVFRLSDAALKGDYDRAAAILGDLLKMRIEPIMILAVLAGQFRRIYTARMALDNGKGREWLRTLWGMKDYPAKLCMEAANRTRLADCAEVLRMCEELDRRMKSESGLDAPGELKFLLVRLAARESRNRSRGTSGQSHKVYGGGSYTHAGEIL